MKGLRKATCEDEELQQIRKVVIEGWPENKTGKPHKLRPYWSIRDEIS